MRRRIDGVLDQIDYVCMRYFPRIAEGCLSLMLLGLAAYIADERVMIAGLIQAPPYTPIWAFVGLLVVTCAAHLTGLFMPALHRWLARRGVRQRWLTTPLFDEFIWRRACCVVSMALFGAYAGVMSQMRWTAWVFAVPYSLLMSAAFIRLGGIQDGRTDYYALVGSSDPRSTDAVNHPADLVDRETPKGQASRRSRTVTDQAQVNRRWRESAGGFADPV